jgi:hypothetical protein
MKYNFEVRSIAQQNELIEDKHQKFLSCIERCPPPWAPVERPSLPPIGGQLSCSLKASKIFGKGLRGDVVYQFRRPFLDEASQDDYINISFNPKKIDYRVLTSEVLTQYVTGFDAYYAEISDDEFIFLDFEAKRQARFDKRRSIFRLHPVTFVSNSLCLSAFSRPASDVAELLRDDVASLHITSEGLTIVLCEEPISTAEMNDLSWSVTNRLRARLG